MFEQRWREVVARFPDQWALTEMDCGRRWSFAELAAAADAAPARVRGGKPGEAELVCPGGRGLEFILELLRGWRAGSVICPLDTGQPIPEIPPLPRGIVHLKLTSGTTGAGKVVAFTADQLAADVDQLVPAMDLHRGSPNVAVLSLAHSYGFSSLVLPLLLHGIPLVLAESALPAAVAAAVAAHPPVTLPAVPALWRTWHEAGAIPSGLHRAISAGAPLPLGLEQAVHADCGVKLHNFLGASECGGIAYDASSTPRADAAYVGAAIPGLRLATSEAGRLVVRGASVGTGYWPASDSAAETFGGGRLETADLADVDEHGGVWLRGRSGDVINVAGRKVVPEVIERLLLTHPAVADCLVVGVPDREHRGEYVGVAVVRRAEVSEVSLRDFLLTQGPDWQVPRRWWWVPELETNGRGKRSRREWAERLATLPPVGR